MKLTESVHNKLSDAIQSGNTKFVESLIQSFPELVNHPRWTPPPLHCAILWNQPKIAELLLENGANIELRDPDRQSTPLRYAVMYCKTELISLLISRGAEHGAIKENGITSLQLAKEAAAGAFESYEDLPSSDAYDDVVNTLLQCGVID